MSRSGSRYFILSPVQDAVFLLLTPLFILIVFSAARRGRWLDGLLAFVLALAMGHYLPGMLRAYGDRALFRRFRLRLILAPLFFLTVTSWFAYYNLNFVFLIVGLWGAWHWTMQVYGFARIYDAKSAPQARARTKSGWLDRLVCVFWFGMCVFVLNNVLPIYVTRFYENGGPPLPAAAFVWLTRVWFALTVTVTLLYLTQTVRRLRSGEAPNPLKFVLIAGTFIYLSYAASMLDQPMVGYAMFESWHDIQYLAIVWMFNISRVQKTPEAGSFLRVLFRPRAILVVAYVAMCLAFGSVTHAWRLFEDVALARVAAAFVVAMALLHYYLDGFIWKIREPDTRGVLIGADAPAIEPSGHSRPALVPAWLGHALLWLMFVGPAAALFAMEPETGVRRPLQVFESLVDTFPDSPGPHFELGKQLQEAGRLREAKVHFERVLALSPGSYPALVQLGVLLVDQGHFADASPYFESALKIDPDNAQLHNNFGIALDEQSDLVNAKAHLERAVAIDPQYALAQNNLGTVLGKLGELESAKTHHERAIQIDPSFADAHNKLGQILLAQGKTSEARMHFEAGLRIEPNDASLLGNLQKAIQAESGR
jgi:tetratricopeptide (TPR) repeat protein